MCFRPLVDIQLFNNINLLKPIINIREVVLSLQVRRRGRDQNQIIQRKTSLMRVYRFFDDKLLATASELRRDLKMSPNVIQRNLEILTKSRYLMEIPFKKTAKIGRKRVYCSTKNWKFVQYLIDVFKFKYQAERGKTKLVDLGDLQDMILMSELMKSKNSVAKLYGLKSGKSFERLVRSYPSMIRYREELRANKNNKSWTYLGHRRYSLDELRNNSPKPS